MTRNTLLSRLAALALLAAPALTLADDAPPCACGAHPNGEKVETKAPPPTSIEELQRIHSSP